MSAFHPFPAVAPLAALSVGWQLVSDRRTKSEIAGDVRRLETATQLLQLSGEA